MKRHRFWISLLSLAALMALCAPAMFADTPGNHPGYLHAMSDLRYARALLNSSFGDQYPAVREISAAMDDLKNASWDDHKNPEDHPRIDAHLERAGRLHKTMEALDSAEHHLMQEEDNAKAAEWRNRALGHIREAKEYVHREMGGH
ncbi:MAG TPA: hypothetical protein VGL89_18130 [Candidatus Koribacter sp.]|jgi:hypothetical protein